MIQPAAIFTTELPESIDSSSPDNNLIQKEFFAELDRKLQALPPKQKRAFILAQFEELPYEQIAQIEGIRLGTVKSRINRAKKKLKQALESYVEDINE